MDHDMKSLGVESPFFSGRVFTSGRFGSEDGEGTVGTVRGQVESVLV